MKKSLKYIVAIGEGGLAIKISTYLKSYLSFFTGHMYGHMEP